ncbi:hypothetical protein M407DRAFT_17736 [Tulasnella calospora MUT 4182]|uniref:MIF4G domain-containing protein n=1 Tax=Tulasnella calospora MUT 4182 TaxID=1051891 RepID=A0A0C3QV99_9AGAM|nr:hypothetical protein M407DRAFT_17736 [Tulasnella calospora MUT 4182]
MNDPNRTETLGPQPPDSGHSPASPPVASEVPISIQIEKDQDKASQVESGHGVQLGDPEGKKEAKAKVTKAARAAMLEKNRKAYEQKAKLEEEEFRAFLQGRPFLPGLQLQAVASAKRIGDLGAVTYPKGINAPSEESTRGQKEGRYKYNREFLLQFRLPCRAKPNFASNVDRLGIGRHVPSYENDSKPPGRTKSSPINLASDSVQGNVDARSGPNSLPVPQVPNGDPTVRTRSQRGRKAKNNLVPGEPDTSQPPVPPLRITENRWTPWSVEPNTHVRNENSLESAERKIKALLNRLVPKTLDSVLDQLVGCMDNFEGERSSALLDLVAKLVLEQAADTTLLSGMFARLSRKMVEKTPAQVQDSNVRDVAGEPVVGGHLFRKYLLSRCQEYSKRCWSSDGAGALDSIPQDYKVDGVGLGSGGSSGQPLLFSNESYAIWKAKRHGLNLVRFMGELFKVQILTERVIHETTKSLLFKTKAPKEGEVERLCVLLTTIGQRLDTPKTSGHINIYFGRIEQLVEIKNLSSRHRFMLMDLIDLKKRNWGPRKITTNPPTVIQSQSGTKSAGVFRKKKELAKAGPGGRSTNVPQLGQQVPKHHRSHPNKSTSNAASGSKVPSPP